MLPDRLPATGHRLPTTGYRLPATDYRPPATGYRLPATGYRLSLRRRAAYIPRMPLFGVDGERIGYTIYPHRKNAPPLLLFHGFTASAASFAANLPELRKHFTVVTVDLLGHGSSDAPSASEAYAPEQAVARVVALMDHLGFEDALLCGHSLGGALAVRVALDHPDRVAGIVVINSNSAAGTAEWRRDVQPGLVEMANRVRGEGTAFLKGTRLYPARSRRLPDESRRLLTEDFDRLTADGIAGTAEGLVARVNAFERLPELAVPTLVVAGDRDAEFMRNAPALLEALRAPIVRSVTLADAGHAANLEQPAAFEAALLDLAHEIGYTEPHADDERPNGWLVMAGAAFIALGAALIGASFWLGDSDGPTQATGLPTRPANDVAGIQATPTPTALESGSATAAAVAGATLSPSPTATPTASATPTPVPAEEPEEPEETTEPATETATLEPATPTPTAEETLTVEPTQVATPDVEGLSVAIYGPDHLGVGEPGAFRVAVDPLDEVIVWIWDNGARSERDSPRTFAEAGCHQLSVSAAFSGGRMVTGTKTVAVGQVEC